MYFIFALEHYLIAVKRAKRYKIHLPERWERSYPSETLPDLSPLHGSLSWVNIPFFSPEEGLGWRKRFNIIFAQGLTVKPLNSRWVQCLTTHAWRRRGLDYLHGWGISRPIFAVPMAYFEIGGRIRLASIHLAFDIRGLGRMERLKSDMY
jgi:hypothetical protein